jgi:hypothetical protein
VAIGYQYAGVSQAPVDGLIVQGNVAIGATNATSTLLIQGSGAASATSSLDVVNTSGTHMVYVEDDAKVGINNSTPSSTLDVNGTLTISGGVANKLNRSQTGAANLVPICYGTVSATGSVTSGTGNFTVVTAGPGIFRMTIAGEAYNTNGYSTVATLINAVGMISTASNGSALEIATFDKTGIGANQSFSFVVYKY